MSQAEDLVAALGGFANIVDIEPCITRLRTEVSDPSKVDDAALKAAGATGVMRAGVIVQVIVGPDADTIAANIEEIR